MTKPNNELITLHDISGKSYTASTSEIRWRPSAYAIIIKSNKILLAKEEGSYILPGGGINIGEDFEEALSREVKEETGVIVKSIRPYTFKSSYFVLPHTKKGKYVQTILLYYLADYHKGEITLEHIPAQERKHHQLAEWINLKDLRNIKINSTYDWREIVESLK